MFQEVPDIEELDASAFEVLSPSDLSNVVTLIPRSRFIGGMG